MSDFEDNDDDANGGSDSVDDEELIDDIAEDVRTDILLGHVEDDVSHVLEERLDEVGLQVPPDEIDELAEEIENDVSS